MADKLPEVKDRKLTDVLRRLDADLNEPTKYAPPRVREQPAIQPTAALLTAGESTIQTIKTGIEELKKRLAALEKTSEQRATQLKNWTDEIANQHAQILESMNTFENIMNESVERIVQIGRPPQDDVPQQQQDPYPGRTRSGEVM